MKDLLFPLAAFAAVLLLPQDVKASAYGDATTTSFDVKKQSTIEGGSTITLDGVVTTMGSSDMGWSTGTPSEMVNNGTVDESTGKHSETCGITTFDMSSTLPEHGAFLKIIPSKDGTISITETEASTAGKITFVTVEDGTITNVNSVSNSGNKNEITRSYNISNGKVYYFFQCASKTKITGSRNTIITIAFAEAVAVSPQDISTYTAWNFIEEPDTWKSNTIAGVHESLALTGSASFDSTNGRYQIAAGTNATLSFNATSTGYIVTNGKSSVAGKGIKLTIDGTEQEILKDYSGMVYSRKITFAEGDAAKTIAIGAYSDRRADIFSIAWIPEGSDQDNATKSVALDSKGYATYYPCYAVKVPTGVKAYYITEANTTAGEITFTEVTDIIPANTAVLLVGQADDTVSFDPTDDIETGSESSAISYNNAAGGKGVTILHYAYKADGIELPGATGTEDYYAYKKGTGTFAKVTADLVFPYGRAYFTATKSTSNAKGIALTLNSETTGANSVRVQQTDTDNAWYTLQGVRIEHPIKGISIQNGKKIIK